MTEPQPAEAANEEMGKRRTAGAESVSKAPAPSNAMKAAKDDGRPGLKTQGAVDIAPAEKPTYVRAYNKAPNLDRPFDAVDMDEKAEKDAPTPLVTGPAIKPTESERTRMPADEPPVAPAQDATPGKRTDAEPAKIAPEAAKNEARALEKVTPSHTEDPRATDSDEESTAARD